MENIKEKRRYLKIIILLDLKGQKTLNVVEAKKRAAL